MLVGRYSDGFTPLWASLRTYGQKSRLATNGTAANA